MSFEIEGDSFTGKVNLSAQQMHDEYTLPDSFSYTLIGLHIAIVAVTVTGNVIIVALFLSKKIPKSNANFYLMASAVSDILLVLCSVPFAVFNNLVYHMVFGQFMCSAARYIITACVIQRSLTLIASSFDRYHAIRWPLKKHTTRTAVIITIVAIWIISLILSIPVGKFSQIDFYGYENASSICIEVWPRYDYRRAFNIVMFFLTYILPLFVLTITNSHIIRILDTKPPGEDYGQLPRKRRAIKRKAIKLFLLTFGAYAVCWLPIHAITITDDFTPKTFDRKVVYVMQLLAQCLAVSNSAINPIIALASERKFRIEFYGNFRSQNNEIKGKFTAQQMAKYTSVHSRYTSSSGCGRLSEPVLQQLPSKCCSTQGTRL